MSCLISNYVEILSDFNKCFDCGLDLVGSVATGDLAPDAGCSKRDYRVRETDDIDVKFHELFSELSSYLGTTEEHRDNWRVIVAHDVEARRFHSNSEGLGVAPEVIE